MGKPLIPVVFFLPHFLLFYLAFYFRFLKYSPFPKFGKFSISYFNYFRLMRIRIVRTNQANMSTHTLAEEYTGHAQHRIVVRVMQALATVRSSVHMDDQLAAVAHQLKQPTRNTMNEPFEVALGMMIAGFAGGEMSKARENLRTMHYNPGHHEETLDLLDPTWKNPVHATVSLTSAGYNWMYPAAAGSPLLQGSMSPPLLLPSPTPLDSRPATPQSPPPMFPAPVAAMKCEELEDDEVEVVGFSPPPRRRCMPVRFSSYIVGTGATLDDDESSDYSPFA